MAYQDPAEYASEYNQSLAPMDTTPVTRAKGDTDASYALKQKQQRIANKQIADFNAAKIGKFNQQTANEKEQMRVSQARYAGQGLNGTLLPDQKGPDDRRSQADKDRDAFTASKQTPSMENDMVSDSKARAAAGAAIVQGAKDSKTAAGINPNTNELTGTPGMQAKIAADTNNMMMAKTSGQPSAPVATVAPPIPSAMPLPDGKGGTYQPIGETPPPAPAVAGAPNPTANQPSTAPISNPAPSTQGTGQAVAGSGIQSDGSVKPPTAATPSAPPAKPVALGAPTPSGANPLTSAISPVDGNIAAAATTAALTGTSGPQSGLPQKVKQSAVLGSPSKPDDDEEEGTPKASAMA